MANSKEPVIETSSITKKFKELAAVNSVSIKVESGEIFVGWAGHNVSGFGFESWVWSFGVLVGFFVVTARLATYLFEKIES